VRVGISLEVVLLAEAELVEGDDAALEDEVVRLTAGGVILPVVGSLPEQAATATTGSAAAHARRARHLPGPRGIPHCA
jgi:hypothetical protein